MKPGGIALALAIAVFLAVRWRAAGVLLRALAVVALLAAIAYGAGIYELPNLEKLIKDVGTTLGEWTYLLVGLMAFLETGAFVGLVAPGETTVLVGGLVAGQGQIDIVLLIAIVWSCAVAGDVTSYLLGRRLGRGFLVRHGPRLKITEERINQVEAFFARRGGITILIGRFIGLVRAIAPFLAGASRMSFARFLPYDVVGAGAWGAGLCLLGFVFWRSFDKVTNYVGKGLFAFATSVGLIVALVLLIRLARDRERRGAAHAFISAQAEKPVLRPLARVLRPAYHRGLRPALVRLAGPARFAWNRLTPGRLGLEFTSAVALLAVGAYAATVLYRAADGSLFVDRKAYDLAGTLHNGAAVDVVKIVTALGSAVVAAAVVALVALWALHRRRWLEAIALSCGLALTIVAVHILKDARDRPRPPASLVETAGSSFPSGHAAYAVAFVPAMAVLIRCGSSLVVRFAGVTVALVLGAVVAVSRIYLRAHWLTDVIGGIAVGVACFGLVGMVALVVAHVNSD